jgi:HEAT repeat protein
MTAHRRVLLDNQEYVLVTNVGTARIRLQYPDGTEIAYWDMDADPRWVMPLAGFNRFRTGMHLERMDQFLVQLSRERLGLDELPHPAGRDVKLCPGDKPQLVRSPNREAATNNIVHEDEGPEEYELDRIVDEGECVFEHDWDSGGPGAGGGSGCVYLWQGKYAVVADSYDGPPFFASLDEALDYWDLLKVTDASTGIRSSQLGSRDIASRLCVPVGANEIAINGELWEFDSGVSSWKTGKGSFRITVPVAIPDKGAIRSVSDLIERLGSPYWKISSEAAEDLEGRGGGIVTSLLQHLRSHPSVHVRGACARLLVKLKPQTDEIAEALIDTLKTDSYELIHATCYALGDLGAAASYAVPTLLATAERMASRNAQDGIGWALGKIGAGAAAGVPFLIGMLKGPDPALRLRGVYSLGRMGVAAEPALSALLDTFQRKAGDVLFRSQVASVIAALGPRGLQALTALADSADDEIRLMVEQALAESNKSKD